MNTYIFSQVLQNPELMAAAGAYQLTLGNDKDFLRTRVSYKLDLRGPSMTMWSVGVKLNWSGLHGSENPRRVPLPTYPFERKKHWAEAVGSATTFTDTNARPPPRDNNIEDWLFAPTWLRSSLSKDVVPSLTGVRLVLEGSETRARAVADRISKAGGESLRIRDSSFYAKADDGSYQLRVGNAEDGAMFSRDLRRDGRKIDELKSGMIQGLLAIEAAGGEFEVVTADVSDETAMREVVAVGRKRWGTIDAVIQAPGVPGKGELSVLKASEDIDAVFSPKIAGLDILLKVLGGASLDLVASYKANENREEIEF